MRTTCAIGRTTGCYKVKVIIGRTPTNTGFERGPCFKKQGPFLSSHERKNKIEWTEFTEE